LQLTHSASPLKRHALRPLDVPVLRRLVPAAEQNDQFGPLEQEVDAVARAVRNPHLANATANALRVTEITILGAMNARHNSRRRPLVLEAQKPSLELQRAARAIHAAIVSNWRHRSIRHVTIGNSSPLTRSRAWRR